MTDYTNTFGGAAKDAADSNILGSDHDTELDNIVTAIGTKADKVVGAVSGNLVELDANGQPVDSGIPASYLTGLTQVVQTQLDAAADNTAVVAAHKRAGNVQVRDGSDDPDQLAVHSAMAADTWESVGPTGSGADNIWAALDVLPSSATVLIVFLQQTCASQFVGPTIVTTYATGGNDATPALNQDTMVFKAAAQADAGGGETSLHGDYILIPLHTDQTFQIHYNIAGVSTSLSLICNYKGFMND